MQKICYQRLGPGGDAEIGPSERYESRGIYYEEVCNTNSGFPRLVPNLAFTWRAGRALGFGLAVVPPSSYGKLEWPVSVPKSKGTGTMPAPQRYLSEGTEGTMLFPTLAFGVEVADGLRIGAGFVSGLAILKLKAGSISQVARDEPRDRLEQDARSIISVKDLFVPGVVLGGHYSASRHLDFGVWYRFLDRIRAKGNIEVVAGVYDDESGEERTLCERPDQSKEAGPTGEKLFVCAEHTKSEEVLGRDDTTRVNIAIPMEARAGARWHEPFGAPTPLERERFRADAFPTRDPLRDDVYDVELDVTWANNSAADVVEVRNEPFQPRGLPSQIPANADRPTGFRDSFGARLGGQYTAMRNFFGLRWGTWIESKAVSDEYLNVTGIPGLRGGFGGGFVVRIQAVDVEGGYQHIWNGGLDNGGDGALKAIAGTTGTQADAETFDNRSYHAVNGGKATQHANVLSLGAVVRF
jgi:long-chain fatty acid transport protein